MSEVTCPRCGSHVLHLTPLDEAIKSKLVESGNAENLPGSVCDKCFSELAGSIARGSLLLAHEKAKEQQRLTMWKSRVGLIKKARQCMMQRLYSDAAVAYEKYLRVLEIIFECKPGQLTPEIFKDTARTQEITVVASVYWDLLRIYDTSDRYREKQNEAASKLAQFLRFTPVYADIVKRAQSFVKTAKNPNAFKNFLKLTGENSGRCFIATCCYEYPMAEEVMVFRKFRDDHLEKNKLGKIFIILYYKTSPSVVFILEKSPLLKAFVKKILDLLIMVLKK